MTITTCPHGMGIPAACIDCLADGPCRTSTGATAVPVADRWIRAQHDTRCPACGDRIDADDEVGRVGRSWFCTGCAV